MVDFAFPVEHRVKFFKKAKNKTSTLSMQKNQETCGT